MLGIQLAPCLGEAGLFLLPANTWWQWPLKAPQRPSVGGMPQGGDSSLTYVGLSTQPCHSAHRL